MLGEIIAEFSSKITGVRVLPSEEQSPKVEVSFQGSGKLLGENTTDVGTYWQTVRPGGMLYGEGQVMLMPTSGDMALWSGFGIGRSLGKGLAGTYRCCGSIQTTSQKLARLNSVAAVVEYEVDENENYSYKIWEWK